jgi:WD40 repeat protein
MTLPAGGFPARSLAYHDDTLVTGEGPLFVVWSTGPTCGSMPQHACRLAARLSHSGSWISSVALDRTGTLLATGLQDGYVDLWDVSHPRTPVDLGVVVKEPKGINQVSFSPTQDVLVAAGNDRTLRLWNVKRPTRPLPLSLSRASTQVTSVAFAPNGQLLASGGRNNQVALWSVGSKKGAVRRPENFEQTNTIDALAFSPDGKVLAAGDDDGATCLYEVETLLRIGSCLQGHYSSTYGQGTVYAVRFMPNGTLLTAGNGNPVVAWKSILWNRGGDTGTLQKLEDVVCRLASRNLEPAEWKQIFAFTRFANDPHATCRQYPGP